MRNDMTVSTADSPVRRGIIGTARIARKVAVAFHDTPGAELVSVASRSAERAAAWASEYGVLRSCGSYKTLLADDGIDAVYFPLPPSMHAEWTIKAANAGKHVLCEKPLALNADEAQEMIAACQSNNVQLMDVTMWVHHPRAEDMRRELSGLGELRRVTSAFSIKLDRYLPNNPSHLAPDGAAHSLQESAAWELRLRPDLGGGALGDLGWYCVRAILWAIEDMPLRIQASARCFNGVDLNLSATMWFDGDRMASFDCGYDMATRKWFEVAGTDGSMVCDDFVGPTDASRMRFWIHSPPAASLEHQCATPIQEQCMVERFCDIVHSGKLDESWPAISLKNQRVCDAIMASARSGETVDL